METNNQAIFDTRFRCNELADAKYRDRNMQLIMLCVTVILVPFTFGASMFLMGLTHVIGTFYWMGNGRDIPQMKVRKAITVINVGILLSLAFVLYFKGAEAAVIGLIFCGLVSGPAYIVVTFMEIKYYKQLANEQS